MCSHVARPFFWAFHAALLTPAKCKRFSSQMLLRVRQMIVFRTLLWSLQSGSSKQMYWTQTGEAIRHAHFHTRKIKKSGRPGKRTSRHLPFVSETIQSVVWLPFASNITTAESKRNEKYFFDSCTVRHLFPYIWIRRSRRLSLTFCQLYNPPPPTHHCRRSLRIKRKTTSNFPNAETLRTRMLENAVFQQHANRR